MEETAAAMEDGEVMSRTSAETVPAAEAESHHSPFGRGMAHMGLFAAFSQSRS